MKNISWYIANKLSLGTTGRRIYPAVVVAIVGVALSVIIMIVSVAIVLGFQKEIKNKVIGFNSHITLFPNHTTESFSDNIIDTSGYLPTILNSKQYIANWTLTTSIPAILKTETAFKGVYLHGVSDNYDFSFLSENILSGKIPEFKFKQNLDEIIISNAIAMQLNLKVGDEINIYFVNPGVRVRPMTVAAIYDTHFEDYDNLYVYCSSSMIQDLNNLSYSQGTSIEISVDNFDNVEQYAGNLNSSIIENVLTGNLSQHYNITTAVQSGASYWGWLSLLDTNVVVIIILMIVVACFTLISGMLILILEKIPFIGLMKSIGATNKLIRIIFMKLTLRIASVGLIIGNIIAIIIIYFQSLYHGIKLDPQSYYIDYVPVDLNFVNIILINVLMLIMISVVLILPSYVIVKISPARTIRYE